MRKPARRTPKTAKESRPAPVEGAGEGQFDVSFTFRMDGRMNNAVKRAAKRQGAKPAQVARLALKHYFATFYPDLLAPQHAQSP